MIISKVYQALTTTNVGGVITKKVVDMLESLFGNPVIEKILYIYWLTKSVIHRSLRMCFNLI